MIRVKVLDERCSSHYCEVLGSDEKDFCVGDKVNIDLEVDDSRLKVIIGECYTMEYAHPYLYIGHCVRKSV